MKLSHWAKENGIKYKTAHYWVKNNKMPVPFSKTPTGTILVHPEKNNNTKSNVYIYTRVSSYDRKDSLISQVDRCTQFAIAKGLSVDKVIKEIASGMNDKRPKLIKMLNDNPSHIIVEHKDRLTRFGFNYLELLLSKNNCEILVLNKDQEDETDLIKDMISIITSFCCRLYGIRRGRNKVNKIKEELVK